MMRFAATGISLSALICLAGAPARSQSSDGDPGMEMFKRHCASCHGASGQGDGPRAGVLKIAPTDLTRLSRDNGGTFPKAKVADVIKTGGSPLGHGTDMPAWMKIFGVKGQPDETRNRIHRLVQYIESLQK